MIFVAALILTVYTLIGGFLLKVITDACAIVVKWQWCFLSVAAVVLMLFCIFGVEAVSPISC